MKLTDMCGAKGNDKEETVLLSYSVSQYDSILCCKFLLSSNSNNYKKKLPKKNFSNTDNFITLHGIEFEYPKK